MVDKCSKQFIDALCREFQIVKHVDAKHKGRIRDLVLWKYGSIRQNEALEFCN